jgi:hypothetical protein
MLKITWQLLLNMSSSEFLGRCGTEKQCEQAPYVRAISGRILK